MVLYFSLYNFPKQNMCALDVHVQLGVIQLAQLVKTTKTTSKSSLEWIRSGRPYSKNIQEKMFRTCFCDDKPRLVSLVYVAIGSTYQNFII